MRRNIFRKGEIFHVFNKSIANFGIFKDFDNGQRFIQALGYYNNSDTKINLAKFITQDPNFSPDLLLLENNHLVKFIAFCIMPDHYHLLLKILCDKVMSKYIGDVENSFSRYFNIRYKRKGPIWQSRFKAVKIKNNEQLLHVSRYVHINPTTNNLVKNPEDWNFSSYRLLISNPQYLKKLITEYSINKISLYKKFIQDRIDYQKTLRTIKKQIIE